MAIISGKAGPRQIFLIFVLIILAIIVGIYFYSTKRPTPTPRPAARPEMLVEEGAFAPEAAAPVAPERAELAPKITLTPELLSSKRIQDILANLKTLELVLHGKLPIEVEAEEIGRTNPFIPY